MHVGVGGSGLRPSGVVNWRELVELVLGIGGKGLLRSQEGGLGSVQLVCKVLRGALDVIGLNEPEEDEGVGCKG